MFARDIKRVVAGSVVAAIVVVGTPALGEEPAPTAAARAPVKPGGARHNLTPAYVLFGVGAISAGATAVLYLRSRSIQNSADDAFGRSCPNGIDWSNRQCAIVLGNDESAASMRTGALLLGAGALVGLIGGTAAFVIESKRGGQEAGVADSATLRAWLSPTGAGVSGTF